MMPRNDNVAVPPLLRSFVVAQFADLFKLSLWWASLSPLLMSLVKADATIIGVARIAYNAALCVFSPMGAILVEWFHPTTILIVAAIVRFVIYAVLVPLVWLLFDTNAIGTESTAVVYACLCVLLFVDGMAVAASMRLDIDVSGVDIISRRFGLHVTDNLRDYLNGAHGLVLSLCFIFFAPAMAFVGIGAKRAFDSHITAGDITSDQAESGTLVIIFMVGFTVASVVQWAFIARMRGGSPSLSHSGEPHVGTVPRPAPHEDADCDDTAAGGHGSGEAGGGPTCGGILTDLKESFLVVIRNRPILFRLIFRGLEIAFEDAAIVVIAAQMGVRCEWLGGGSSVKGNIWTAVAVAAGKLGGAVASCGVMKLYSRSEEPRGYFVLFLFTTVSTVVTCGFPLIQSAHSSGHLSDVGAEGIHLTLFFFYFFFSTLPKPGLMSLLQSLVSKVDNGPRANGCIAIIATTMDATIVMVLSGFFIGRDVDLTRSLWYVAALYVAFGVLQLVLGVLFVLRPLQRVLESEIQPLLKADSGATYPLLPPTGELSSATTAERVDEDAPAATVAERCGPATRRSGSDNRGDRLPMAAPVEARADTRRVVSPTNSADHEPPAPVLWVSVSSNTILMSPRHDSSRRFVSRQSSGSATLEVVSDSTANRSTSTDPDVRAFDAALSQYGATEARPFARRVVPVFRFSNSHLRLRDDPTTGGAFATDIISHRARATRVTSHVSTVAATGLPPSDDQFNDLLAAYSSD